MTLLPGSQTVHVWAMTGSSLMKICDEVHEQSGNVKHERFVEWKTEIVMDNW